MADWVDGWAAQRGGQGTVAPAGVLNARPDTAFGNIPPARLPFVSVPGLAFPHHM